MTIEVFERLVDKMAEPVRIAGRLSMKNGEISEKALHLNLNYEFDWMIRVAYAAQEILDSGIDLGNKEEAIRVFRENNMYCEAMYEAVRSFLE